MKMTPNRVLAAVAVVLAVAVVGLLTMARPAFGEAAQAGGLGGAPHYTVVMTEGHNLLVTDNATNKLYFYTTDKDKPIGTPLKLRASLDLTRVGSPEISITAHNLEK
jgi:hypothetical protein